MNKSTLKHVMFLQKYKEKLFCLWTHYFNRRCTCKPTSY